MCYYFYMITIEEIQKRLREAVKYSGLSQKEIAERLGINPSTVSKYMRLNKYPSLDTFANLCLILDVSADEILGLKD
ncbi:MAG: helix-turn-helix transcriptional regulator [Clostridia bacterium]|nr:helix-turn-helix transcriptional regulator [Clostridia bacterium]